MLGDRSADIRYLGVSFAPMGYKGLSSMVNEIARSVFCELINKINKNDLPLLLANRNLKEKYIAESFQRRMESGI
jgi:hypothetical protein